MSTATYRVSGMTCSHCVRAVSEEVGKITGVSEVEVDLERGEVTVTSEVPLDDDAVRGAVEEAGYEVAV